METALIIIISFALGAIVGLVISTVSHNRFLIKHGIKPKDFYHATTIQIK